MSIVLYGSSPSPYVRRVRMLLDRVDYRFEAVDVYDDDKRSAYSAITPIRKLPVLMDGEKTIFDSHVICEYLRRELGLPEWSFEQLNLVSAVDAVNDALIIMFLATRSGIETSDDKLMFKLQRERIPISLNWLEEQAKAGGFDEWHIATIALISLMDWAEFRGLYDFSEYPALLEARNLHQERAIVRETYPQ
ncbi:glutathione S-transferase family protein [Neptuniibacter sp.]|uniref:glutathione S-transferase family protein n=1 Tax=Neptuniibacter sp. TaxID=1962643 RepID=UPI002623F549|nr:glutathione S-transferase family protein [Neptuniibacter sp.]MCP4597591.1 glutathione S-transferase [Neptuniibacter sp.]